MLIKVLLFYFLSMVALAGAVWGGIRLFKKKEIRLKIGAMLLGGGISVVYLLILFLLYWSTFNANIDGYFFTNSTANNVLVIFLIGSAYVFVLSLVRSLILNAVYFSAKKRDAGFSFDFGFAAAPAMLIGILYFFNFCVKIYYAIFNGPAVWNIDEERFIFGNNIALSPALYTDPAKHFYIMIALIAFFAILLSGAFIFEGIAKKEYKTIWASVGAGAVLLFESLFIASIPWCDFFGWLLIAVLSIIVAAGAVAIAHYLPRKKEQLGYTKQFE
jgi:hypothetical protein